MTLKEIMQALQELQGRIAFNELSEKEAEKVADKIEEIRNLLSDNYGQ